MIVDMRQDGEGHTCRLPFMFFSHSGLQELMLTIRSLLLASAPVLDRVSVWQSCGCIDLCIGCKWPCRPRMTSSKFLSLGKCCFCKSHVLSSFVSSGQAAFFLLG